MPKLSWDPACFFGLTPDVHDIELRAEWASDTLAADANARVTVARRAGIGCLTPALPHASQGQES